jgi:hypothetical protein
MLSSVGAPPLTLDQLRAWLARVDDLDRRLVLYSERRRLEAKAPPPPFGEWSVWIVGTPRIPTPSWAHRPNRHNAELLAHAAARLVLELRPIRESLARLTAAATVPQPERTDPVVAPLPTYTDLGAQLT